MRNQKIESYFENSESLQNQESIRQRIIDLDFRKVDTKYYTHSFHTDPAVMIGPVAKYCIENWLSDAKIIIDPFVGSGSVLVEGSVKGKTCIGVDLNPLAVMISRVKTRTIDLDKVIKYTKIL